MPDYVDQTAWAIFGELHYELARDQLGRLSIYETKAQAEAHLKKITHPANNWRVAPIRIYNGGFVPNQIKDAG